MRKPPPVPDVGDTFTVTRSRTWRQWRWRPVPWYRKHAYTEVHGYRVTGWLRRRRPPLPLPRDEQERLTRVIIAEMLAGKGLEPRGAGPDNVPLQFCLREEAEYVCGAGVAGVIVRVSDVVLDGRVPWSPEALANARQHAEQLAGEPLT